MTTSESQSAQVNYSMSREGISERISKELLRIGAVSLSPSDPYTWASGIKSPVYCDNRMIMGFPVVRDLVAAGLEALIEREELACDVIAGTATAGIPHAAWLAQRMDLPMVYIRGAAKAHGKGRQVEGPLHAGQRVVVIEDLVSTGMSSTAVIEPIQSTGAVVSAVLAIFTYGLAKADTAFSAAGVPLFTLTSFPELISHAIADGFVSAEDERALTSWYKDPESWGTVQGA